MVCVKCDICDWICENMSARVALWSRTLPHALYVHGQGPVHEQCSSSVMHVTTIG